MYIHIITFLLVIILLQLIYLLLNNKVESFYTETINLTEEQCNEWLKYKNYTNKCN